MTVQPVRRRNNPRPVTTNERDGFFQVYRILADAAIRPSEVLAPHTAQHLCRSRRFLRSLLDRSIAPHLAPRQITQTDAEPERGVACDHSAQTNLDVVGM